MLIDHANANVTYISCYPYYTFSIGSYPGLVLETGLLIFELHAPVTAIRSDYNSLLSPDTWKYAPYSSPIQALRFFLGD